MKTLTIILILISVSCFGQNQTLTSDSTTTGKSTLSVHGYASWLMDSLSVTFNCDTSIVVILKPVNIEIMQPVHHWEENYYGVNKCYVDYNIITFEKVYCIKRTNNYYMTMPEYEYYSMDWEKISNNQVIFYMSEGIKIDTIRLRQ